MSIPIATAIATGTGSAVGAIVAFHAGHPTAGSVATGAIAGLVTLIGGPSTIARAINPVIRYLKASPNPGYQR